MASVRSRAAAPFAVRQVMRTGTDYTADTIGEAVMAYVLADAVIEKFGGDSLDEVRRNLDGYLGGLP